MFDRGQDKRGSVAHGDAMTRASKLHFLIKTDPMNLKVSKILEKLSPSSNLRLYICFLIMLQVIVVFFLAGRSFHSDFYSCGARVVISRLFLITALI